MVILVISSELMKECIKQLDCVINWISGNLVWEILLVILIVFIPNAIKILRISKILLKQNRYTKGNGCGTHMADRYIDCWRSKKGLHTENGFYVNPRNIPSRWRLGIIDEKLEEKKLVYSKDKNIYPIINLKNKLIIKILKFYLIHITGDNKNEYKNL